MSDRRRALTGVALAFALLTTAVFAPANAEAQGPAATDSILIGIEDITATPTTIGNTRPIENHPATKPEHFSDRPVISDVDVQCGRQNISVTLTISARGPVSGSLEWFTSDGPGDRVALAPTGIPGRWAGNVAYPGTSVGIWIKARTDTGGALVWTNCPVIT